MEILKAKNWEEIYLTNTKKNNNNKTHYETNINTLRKIRKMYPRNRDKMLF